MTLGKKTAALLSFPVLGFVLGALRELVIEDASWGRELAVGVGVAGAIAALLAVLFIFDRWSTHD